MQQEVNYTNDCISWFQKALTFQNWSVLFGGFAGMLSLGILLIKYVSEKPKLKTIVENVFYTPPYDPAYNFSTFFFTLRFENKGRRNTTVHSAELSIEYQGKTYSPVLEGQIEVVVIADDVKRKQVNFLLQKNHYVIPEGTIRNAKLKISHTYDSEELIVEEIERK